MNADFLQEMTSVQEAFDMWKVNHYDDSKIPTDGIVQSKDVTGNGRLYGEIAYYRRWSESEDGKRPEKDVLNKNCFDDYDGDLVVIPRGIEDLYYLNNKEIGINNDKVYIIDAVNSMIYRVSGYTVKSVDVHSLPMYREVTGGSVDVQFASAEVEGGGDNIKYAGEKYYKDKNGNYVDENGNIVDEDSKVENPYGFEIIASPDSTNIYKLYNNGDLYAKGVKGTSLNTSSSEMESIRSDKWQEFTVPSEIGEYKKIIPGYSTIFIIDSKNKLWALGDNSNNKLGLTEEQLSNYTGREAVKLNVNNKDVYNVFSGGSMTFVATTDGELYVMGNNNYSLMGLGHDNQIDTFQKINGIPDSRNITKMIFSTEGDGYTLLEYLIGGKKKYYACGSRAKAISGRGYSYGEYKLFTPIWDGYDYTEINGDVVRNESVGYSQEYDIAQNIRQVISVNAQNIIILKDDNKAYYIGPGGGWSTGDIPGNYKIVKLPQEFNENIKNIYSVGYGYLIERDNGDVWGANGESDSVGINGASRTAKQVNLPEDLQNDGIKEIYTTKAAVYYLSKTGDLYASSSSNKYFGGSENPIGVQKVDIGKISTLYYFETINNQNSVYTTGTQLFLGEDKKYYSIGNTAVTLGNKILQSDWINIAKNVKKVYLGEDEEIAYIEKNTNNVYIAGNDSRKLGQKDSVQRKIPNLKKLEDDILKEGVEDITFPYGQMMILTKEGNVYNTGLYSINGSKGWPGGRIPGWEGEENHYDFVNLFSNASMISGNGHSKFVVSNGTLYYWGYFVCSATLTPKELDIVSGSNVRKIISNNPQSGIITNDGKLIYGNYTYSTNKTIEYRDISEQFGERKVIDMVINSRNNSGNEAIVLTEDGCVYGKGLKSSLGLGISTSETTDDFVKLPIDNVVQIAGNAECFIAVKKDGTVWGTGKNTYGILGRWIGTDRNKPNSRYQTSYDWVECPELEL